MSQHTIKAVRMLSTQTSASPIDHRAVIEYADGSLYPIADSTPSHILMDAMFIDEFTARAFVNRGYAEFATLDVSEVVTINEPEPVPVHQSKSVTVVDDGSVITSAPVLLNELPAQDATPTATPTPAKKRSFKAAT